MSGLHGALRQQVPRHRSGPREGTEAGAERQRGNSEADQLDFNRFLAGAAHARGLSIGLKNDLDQVADLVGAFDWALDEECDQYDECDLLEPFVQSGKAVFQVEYGDESLAMTVCPEANARDFDALIKNLELDAWRIACR